MIKAFSLKYVNTELNTVTIDGKKYSPNVFLEELMNQIDETSFICNTNEFLSDDSWTEQMNKMDEKSSACDINEFIYSFRDGLIIDFEDAHILPRESALADKFEKMLFCYDVKIDYWTFELLFSELEIQANKDSDYLYPSANTIVISPLRYGHVITFCNLYDEFKELLNSYIDPENSNCEIYNKSEEFYRENFRAFLKKYLIKYCINSDFGTDPYVTIKNIFPVNLNYFSKMRLVCSEDSFRKVLINSCVSNNRKQLLAGLKKHIIEELKNIYLEYGYIYDVNGELVCSSEPKVEFTKEEIQELESINSQIYEQLYLFSEKNVISKIEFSKQELILIGKERETGFPFKKIEKCNYLNMLGKGEYLKNGEFLEIPRVKEMLLECLVTNSQIGCSLCEKANISYANYFRRMGYENEFHMILKKRKKQTVSIETDSLSFLISESIHYSQMQKISFCRCPSCYKIFTRTTLKKIYCDDCSKKRKNRLSKKKSKKLHDLYYNAIKNLREIFPIDSRTSEERLEQHKLDLKATIDKKGPKKIKAELIHAYLLYCYMLCKGEIENGYSEACNSNSLENKIKWEKIAFYLLGKRDNKIVNCIIENQTALKIELLNDIEKEYGTKYKKLFDFTIEDIWNAFDSVDINNKNTSDDIKELIRRIRGTTSVEISYHNEVIVIKDLLQREYNIDIHKKIR